MIKRYILYCILLACLIIAGCGDDDENPAEPEKQTKAITSISGVLENWNLGAGKTISLVYGGELANSFGSSEIKEDGSFDITLSIPDSALLESVNGFINGSCQKNITISDPDSKYISGSLVALNGNSIIGYVQHGGAYGQTQNDTVGSFNVDYYYFDRDVNINGSQTCGSIESYNYALNFERGWNRSAGVLTENSASSVKYDYRVDVPAGSKFMFREVNR